MPSAAVPIRQRLSWRKRLLFASIAVVFVLASVLAALLVADLYVHRRAERYAGVNIWGYRGPTIGRKQRGEHRLAVLGGSTAFGYGLDWDKAFPAQLEADLRPFSKNGAPATVVNLGMNSQGAYSFKFTLQDYVSLDYDAVILYEGYNDIGGAPNEYVGRRESPVFRLTGYYPILAAALQEKAMSLRTGGDLDSAYRGRKTVFRPGLAALTAAGALDAAAVVNKSLNAQLDRLSKVPPVAVTFADAHVQDLGCSARWAHYCASVHDGVRFALDHHKSVIVVTQPYISDLHREQQREMRSMLGARFGSDRSVAYVDLGNAIVLSDRRLAYDGMHLSPEGNAIIARDLVGPVTRLMPEAFDAQPPQEAHAK
jgi:hypothetical protein